MKIKDETPGAPLLAPWCAKCGKPVDALRRWYEPGRHVTVFEAVCHGAIERTELKDCDLMDMATDGLEPGVAFRPKIALLPSKELNPHNENVKAIRRYELRALSELGVKKGEFWMTERTFRKTGQGTQCS